MLPKPLKVYLDTSIFNFAISTQDVAAEKEVTVRFLDEVKNGRFLGHVSAIVLREINDTPEKRRQDDLLKLMGQFELETLHRTEEADLLAERYIQEKIIPVKHFDDALHIAIASVHNLDVIVSWNFEHLVKFKTRREVQAVNTLLGYRTIEICTPQEIL
ncbi:MAG: hypothetical protein A3G87_04040 [Omnitrophica bacterium RIFCSPLOWO2_12_FULL_50_11]|nr:MAG: hypothetical protein A3G87_04040 [Omnitrophica bacterium RIFCSPLOWO2_12_FULL_50_11]